MGYDAIDLWDFKKNIATYMFIPFFLGVTFLMQDLFVSRVTKTISQKKMLQRKRKRGWFTKEQMQKTLNWSTSLWLQKIMVRYSPPVLGFACHHCPMFLKCCMFLSLYLPTNSGPISRAPWSTARNLATSVCGRLLAISIKVVSGGLQVTYIALISLLECFLCPTLPMWDIKLQGIQLT